MCTCLEFTNSDHYFGRTLDLEFHYHEEAVITPRNYVFSCPNSLTFKTKYALIGTAMVAGNYPLYYEASNEKGLAMAGLNFPYNCKYFDPKEGKLNLTPFELIPYILGNYATIKEFRNDLENLNITNVCFAESMPLSPLHFMISDASESIVIEQTEQGLKIYENPFGTMTNNPTFDLQLAKLDEFKHLTNKFKQAENPVYGCVGLDAVGLPGDFSSQSRFIKTVFLRQNIDKADNENEAVSQFFHCLDSVSMVKGSVKTKQDKSDITFYTSCINTTKGIYYYKTYNNNQITCLRLTKENMNSSTLFRHTLIDFQQLKCLN